MTILDLPYISQVDGATAGDYRNDCGPACVAMLLQGGGLSASISDVYNAMGALTGDPYITGGQLRRAAAFYGMVLVPTHMTVDGLKAEQDQGHPFIALIKYGCLSGLGITESRFAGPHFLVVLGTEGTGSDEQVVVHDPLYKGNGGMFRRYPARDFWRAWTSESLPGNPVSWGLCSAHRYPVAGAPAEPPPAVPKPPYWGTGVTTANLRLRHHPPDGPIIVTMPLGTVLRILDTPVAGWYHVMHGEIEGWAGAAYIRATPLPSPEPPPPAPLGARKWFDLTVAEQDKLIVKLLQAHGMVDPDGVIVE